MTIEVLRMGCNIKPVSVVYRAKVFTDGLTELEVREIINKELKYTDERLDVEEISVYGGEIKIELSYRLMEGLDVDFARKKIEDFVMKLKTAIEEYRIIKKYLAIYNNCNGNGRSEVKEIMRKVGIPVIS